MSPFFPIDPLQPSCPSPPILNVFKECFYVHSKIESTALKFTILSLLPHIHSLPQFIKIPTRVVHLLQSGNIDTHNPANSIHSSH